MIMRRKNQNSKPPTGDGVRDPRQGSAPDSGEQHQDSGTIGQHTRGDNPGEEEQKAAETSGNDEKAAETSGPSDGHGKENTHPGEGEKHSLQKKVDELTDKHLRLYSEFDNYRKRSVREKADLLKSAAGELIKEMLPMLDDMERALDTIPENQQEARKGMELIHQKLKDLLRKKGLKEMEAIGKPFDTDYHEAITQIPAPQPEMKGMVVDVVEKGYFLHDKVLRYAKVVVGK